MPTLVILEAKAKSGTLGQIKEFLGKRLPETRAYEGCQSLTPYLNEDGRSLVIVEHWESKPHYEKYLAWREETGALASFGELLEGPPTSATSSRSTRRTPLSDPASHRQLDGLRRHGVAERQAPA